MNKKTKPKKAKQVAPKLDNTVISNIDSILPPIDLIQKANQNLYNQDTGEFNNAPFDYLLAGLRE